MSIKTSDLLPYSENGQKINLHKGCYYRYSDATFWSLNSQLFQTLKLMAGKDSYCAQDKAKWKC